MRMKKFDNLENFLKNNLDKYAKTPPEDQWEKIWTNVDKGGGSSSLWTAKNIIFSSVIVLLTGLSIVLYYNWKNVEAQLSERSEAYTEKIESINKLKQEAALNEIKSEVPNLNSENSNAIKSNELNEVSEEAKTKLDHTLPSEIKINENKKVSSQYSNPVNSNTLAHQAVGSKQIQNTVHDIKNKSNSKISSHQATNQVAIQTINIASKEISNTGNTTESNVHDSNGENINNNPSLHSNVNGIEQAHEFVSHKVNIPSESDSKLLVNKLGLTETKLILGDKFLPSNLFMPSLNSTGIKKQNNRVQLTHSFVTGVLMSRTKLKFSGPIPHIDDKRNFVNDNAIYGTNFFAGYQLSTPIGSNYKLNSGLELRKTSYDLSHTINFKFRDGAAPPPMPGQRPIEKDFKYNYNTGSGTISLDVRSVSDTATKIEDQEKLELNVKATNTIVNLSLPLFITKEFNIRNWNLGIGVGSRFYYELSKKFNLNEVSVNHRSLRCDRGNTFVRTETPSSKFSLDAIVQMTVNYNLGSRFRFGISPLFEQSLIDNKKSVNSTYTNTKLGLMGALQWKF